MNETTTQRTGPRSWDRSYDLQQVDIRPIFPYHNPSSMKTTIELPDQLLIEAKAVAARRRTTLKAMIENGLRREIVGNQSVADTTTCYTIDEHGMPVLKSEGDATVSSEMVYRMMEDLGI